MRVLLIEDTIGGRDGIPIVNVGRARSRVAAACTTADGLLAAPALRDRSAQPAGGRS